MPDLAKLVDGKKYMWNGNEYTDKGSAEQAKETYLKDGFEVLIFEEEDKFMVYSRRLVTEIVLDGEGTP